MIRSPCEAWGFVSDLERSKSRWPWAPAAASEIKQPPETKRAVAPLLGEIVVLAGACVLPLE